VERIPRKVKQPNVQAGKGTLRSIMISSPHPFDSTNFARNERAREREKSFLSLSTIAVVAVAVAALVKHTYSHTATPYYKYLCMQREEKSDDDVDI
jgi:hypothetical protein